MLEENTFETAEQPFERDELLKIVKYVLGERT
jgi:hypothetical protein